MIVTIMEEVIREKDDLSGKTAIVTGGNIGIGGAISRSLADCGAKVALTYYSHKEAGEETVKDIQEAGGEAFAFQLDVTKSDMVTDIVGQMAETLGGRVNILVTNAGHAVKRVKISEMSDEHWLRVINVNLSSTFYTVRAALPFIPDGARIVTMASVSARHGGGVGLAALCCGEGRCHLAHTRTG